MKGFISMDERTIARFWSKVDKTGPVPPHMPHLGQCWMWTAYKLQGYGRIYTARGSQGKSHRISWEINNGKIPAGKCVLHRCDTPSCVNPSHLFLGTHADNMRDITTKGRRRSDHQCGSKHGRSKLIESQIIEIRRMRAEGRLLREIAERFGVTAGLISLVASGKIWKHA